MSTLISNCGHDENGGYSGGKAGDQTGTEWQIIPWYNRPWNCVLRHPDAVVRALIARRASAAAKNDNIGYDQSQRDTFGIELKKVGDDPAKIKTPCETDCSKGVIDITKSVGRTLGKSALANVNATYTGNMRAGFRAAGFQVLTDRKYLSSGDYLVEGDIVLNDAYHVATVISNGSKAGVATQSTEAGSNQGGKTTLTAAAASYKAEPTPYDIDKNLTGVYTVDVSDGSVLNLRKGAGVGKTIIAEMPPKSVVHCYGYYNVVGGTKWLYVIYYDKATKKEVDGYASITYLTKTSK